MATFEWGRWPVIVNASGVHPVPEDLVTNFLEYNDGKYVVRAANAKEAQRTIDQLIGACLARGASVSVELEIGPTTTTAYPLKTGSKSGTSGRLRNYKAMGDVKLARTLLSLRTRSGRSYDRVFAGEWTGDYPRELAACETEWSDRNGSAQPSAHLTPG